MKIVRMIKFGIISNNKNMDRQSFVVKSDGLPGIWIHWGLMLNVMLDKIAAEAPSSTASMVVTA